VSFAGLLVSMRQYRRAEICARAGLPEIAQLQAVYGALPASLPRYWHRRYVWKNRRWKATP